MASERAQQFVEACLPPIKEAYLESVTEVVSDPENVEKLTEVLAHEYCACVTESIDLSELDSAKMKDEGEAQSTVQRLLSSGKGSAISSKCNEQSQAQLMKLIQGAQDSSSSTQ